MRWINWTEFTEFFSEECSDHMNECEWLGLICCIKKQQGLRSISIKIDSVGLYRHLNISASFTRLWNWYPATEFNDQSLRHVVLCRVLSCLTSLCGLTIQWNRINSHLNVDFSYDRKKHWMQHENKSSYWFKYIANE